MNRKKILDFITVTLFIGILLSFLLYVGIGVLFNHNSSNGTLQPPEDDNGSQALFNSVFYRDNSILSQVRFCDYRIFRHSSYTNILVGRHDWIFRTVTEDESYDYLLDHVGGNAFTEEELQTIAQRIAERRETYAAEGITYVLMVIPNSGTVHPEYLPGFLGAQSENARLPALTAYLAQNGETAWVNPADAMRRDAAREVLYNNTEDSINAYGAFSLYTALLPHLSSVPGVTDEVLKYEDIQFSVRMTEGKSVARAAGLQEVLKNRTVSLTSDITDDYTVTQKNGLTITNRKNSRSDTAPVWFEFSEDWDRILMTPFLSNAFDSVIYKTGITRDPLSYAGTGERPAAVVQILHESQLQTLLD